MAKNYVKITVRSFWHFFLHLPLFDLIMLTLSGSLAAGSRHQVQMNTTTPDFHRMEARDIQLPEDSRLEAGAGLTSYRLNPHNKTLDHEIDRIE